MATLLAALVVLGLALPVLVALTAALLPVRLLVLIALFVALLVLALAALALLMLALLVGLSGRRPAGGRPDLDPC